MFQVKTKKDDYWGDRLVRNYRTSNAARKLIGKHRAQNAVPPQYPELADVYAITFLPGRGVSHFGIITFFYFKDLDKGMASFAHHGNPEVYFARISALASSIDKITNKPINPN